MKIAPLCAVLALAVFTPQANAQNVFAYPNNNQSQEQQSRDRYECHSWAVQQTGFDPSNPSAVAPVPPARESGSGGEPLAGAAKGAIAGAIIGEVVDDSAGKGAAVGATLGFLRGDSKSRRARQEARERQERQQAAALNNERNNYNRAFGACMTARNYTVQ